MGQIRVVVCFSPLGQVIESNHQISKDLRFNSGSDK